MMAIQWGLAVRQVHVTPTCSAAPARMRDDFRPVITYPPPAS